MAGELGSLYTTSSTGHSMLPTGLPRRADHVHVSSVDARGRALGGIMSHSEVCNSIYMKIN